MKLLRVSICCVEDPGFIFPLRMTGSDKLTNLV